VGKTDIEDALLRLENAILEETRMAAAEALKGIHVLQDRMKGVESVLEGVGDMLQGFDERMKDINQKGINSAQITVQLVIFAINNVFMVRFRERSKSDGKGRRHGACDRSSDRTRRRKHKNKGRRRQGAWRTGRG
jgi:hypothetical protein